MIHNIFSEELVDEKCFKEAQHYIEEALEFLSKLVVFWKDISAQLSRMITEQDNGGK